METHLPALLGMLSKSCVNDSGLIRVVDGWYEAQMYAEYAVDFLSSSFSSSSCGENMTILMPV